MTETQIYEVPTLPPARSTSQGYSFAASKDAVEEESQYANVEFSQPNRITMQQAKSVETMPPSSPTKTKRSQKDFFNLKWILIAVAIALLVNLVVAIIGIWMAVQGNDRNIQAQIEANERLNSAKEALNSNIATQAKGLNTRVDNLQDVLTHHQTSVDKNMNASFTEAQQQVDSLLKTVDALNYRQDIFNKTMNTSFSDNQQQVDSISMSVDGQRQIFEGLFSSMISVQYQIDSYTGAFKIRLVGGNSKSGRVEIYHAGSWGTICDDIIDIDAGNLMCRMLGFTKATEMTCCAYYGQGSGTIWLDDLQCSGNETKLEDCSHNSWGSHNCRHSEDLSITCA